MIYEAKEVIISPGNASQHLLTLLKRLLNQGFQVQSFLMLWISLIQVHGQRGVILTLDPVLPFTLSHSNEETQMTSEYLKHCDALEAQFGRLLFSGCSLRSQFQDFLRENYNHLKDKNESQFMDFIINQKFDGVYDDLIQ